MRNILRPFLVILLMLSFTFVYGQENTTLSFGVGSTNIKSDVGSFKFINSNFGIDGGLSIPILKLNSSNIGLSMYGNYGMSNHNLSSLSEMLPIRAEDGLTTNTFSNRLAQSLLQLGAGPQFNIRLAEKIWINPAFYLGYFKFNQDKISIFQDYNFQNQLFSKQIFSQEPTHSGGLFYKPALKLSYRLSDKWSVWGEANYLVARINTIQSSLIPYGKTNERGEYDWRFVVEGEEYAVEERKISLNNLGVNMGLSYTFDRKKEKKYEDYDEFHTDFTPQISTRDIIEAEDFILVDRSSIAHLEKNKPLDDDSFEKTPSCLNGDIEENNFQNWSFYLGKYFGYSNKNIIDSGLSLNQSNPQSNGDRIVIETPGQDPNIPNLSKVLEGNYSLRIGDNSSGEKNAERAVYTFTVNNNNKDFKYNYAFVVQDGNHVDKKQSFFWVRILDGNNVIYQTGRILPNDANFKKHGNYTYRNWDCLSYDLSGYIGKSIKVEFTVAACSESGHRAYAYIDGLCSQNSLTVDFNLNKSVYCIDDNIIMNAGSTVGAKNFWLTFEESDANWGRKPNTELILYAANNTPSNYISLSLLMKFFKFNLKCNTYYRIKLAANNNCTSWKEKVALIYISCPEVELQTNICVPCKSGPDDYVPSEGFSTRSAVFIGVSDNPNNYQFSWSPSQGLNDPNSPNPIHTVGSTNYPMIYEVTITDQDDCSITKQVRINTLPCNAKIIQIEDRKDCCGELTLKIEGENYTSVQWSTGEKDVNSISVSNPGTYTATLTNECGSYTVSTVVTSVNSSSYTRYHTSLLSDANYSFYSSGTNLYSTGGIHENGFHIINVEDPEPPYGEYFATAYKLIIFNRWGEEIRVIEKEITSCKGFENRSISWDGRDKNGNKVKTGQYEGQLYIKNCNHKEWQQVKVIIGLQTNCLEGNGKCRVRLINRDIYCGKNWLGLKKYEKCKTWAPLTPKRVWVFPIKIFW